MLLITSSEPEGLCYIETSNLDGYDITTHSHHCLIFIKPVTVKPILKSSKHQHTPLPLRIQRLSTHFMVRCARNIPTTLCIHMKGLWISSQTVVFLDKYHWAPIKFYCAVPNCVTLLGSMAWPFLRATRQSWCETQRELHNFLITILVYRSVRAAPVKRTAVERQVNTQIIFLFILLLALSLGSTVGSSIRTWFFSSSQWYLFETSSLSSRGQHCPFVSLSATDQQQIFIARGFIEGIFFHNWAYLSSVLLIFLL